MSETVVQIPLKESVFRNPFANEIGYEAWSIAHELVGKKTPRLISQTIRDYYFFGYYTGEVGNGGHSQLVHNMDIDFIRSPFLTEGFIRIAKQIGAPEFVDVARNFQNWVLENPTAAQVQTGFSGGRAEYLDELDDKFCQLNESLLTKLTKLKSQTKDSLELEYLNDCMERRGDWNGDLNVLESIWLVRSGVIDPIPDDLYNEKLQAILSQ